MEKDNDIDQLFKRGLSDPDIPFNELDWEKMEGKLDAQKKKRVLPLWFLTAGGIAAALTIFLFWFFSNPVITDKDSVKDHLANRAVKPGVKSNPVSPDTSKNNELFLKDNGPLLIKNEALTNNVVKTTVAIAQLPVTISPPEQVPSTSGVLNENPVVSVAPQTPINNQQASVGIDSSTVLTPKETELAQIRSDIEKVASKDILKDIRKKMEKDFTKQHGLILSVMAAPDISTVQASRSSKVSSNLGMLVTYAFNHRFSVTSGAVYAKKFYNSANVVQYYPKMGTSWEVEADCNVLDVPINLNYKLMQGKRLSLSVNAGLSSYFMLKERYDFTSSAVGAKPAPPVIINNQNQHLFGIANLSVSLDHKISQSLSVGVQPFAKLPLTGIGYGNVNLKSTGVAFSLSVGLFSTKKASQNSTASIK